MRNIRYEELYPNRACTSLCKITIPEERLRGKHCVGMTTCMTTFCARFVNRTKQKQ